MPYKDENSYRNPTYIYDEGSGGGGPDSRSSASSTSSLSSMKILGTKLKTQGRTRWVALTAVLIVVVVIIIAVAVAVYFTKSDTSGSSLKRVQDADSQLQNTTMSTPQTTQPSTRKQTITTSGRPVTDTKSTRHFVTTKRPERTTADQTTTITNTTTLPEITSTPFVDTSTPSNASVTLSDVLYNPTDVKTVTLNCQARHAGVWTTLTIRRLFRDSFEPIAVASVSEDNNVDVNVFYPNVTHSIKIRNYIVTLTLNFDPFTCNDLSNFSCAFVTQDVTKVAESNTTIFLSEPEFVLPHSIIEGKQIKLQCTAEVWGTSASLAWKFKHRDSNKFMNFTVDPVIQETVKNCSKFINSTLTINPTMVENGSDFRCEIEDTWVNPQVDQPRTRDVTLNVVPSNFCDDKRQFTIHPHPHGPCTLVVYCLSTGPLVYEIECDPGHCYDYIKTACVPQGAG